MSQVHENVHLSHMLCRKQTRPIIGRINLIYKLGNNDMSLVTVYTHSVLIHEEDTMVVSTS